MKQPNRKFSAVIEGKFYGHEDKKVNKKYKKKNKKWLKSNLEFLLKQFEDLEVSQIKVKKVAENG